MQLTAVLCLDYGRFKALEWVSARRITALNVR
ncbi:MAG: hypothetical protein BWY63_03411 [Chloroflexi bacterium ADurb.Bin360]|jgi:hypothetical protein|nr:MAG: hypothetical protein BWY63_03411 [Chloroflexi bacterium ADurb.Bin360]